MGKHNINFLIRSYPRQRPPLSEELQACYVDIYQQSRNGRGLLYSLTQRLESWMHHKIANHHGSSVLEIGAGTLNHVPYEKNYTQYDIVEPFHELYQNSLLKPKINHIYSDIMDIELLATYDRIISIAALEHITNLPQCLARCGMLLKKQGVFQAAIPAEGGALWGFSWRASVGLNFWLRTRLSYKELMQHEHVNDAEEIILLAKYFFRKVKVVWFPLPHRHMALYAYIEASDPILENCK